jgi:tryptophan synthase alpha chain
MSRLQALFSNKKEQVLNVYCTAGFPNLDSALTVMQSLQRNGADIIELGMPYSDPLADGPIIQQSSLQALSNGMTIATLFSQLNGFRKDINVPVVLMGYLNPVLQYGFENFCKEAAAVGIDGLIIPDLPVHEFETEYGPIVKKYGLDFVFLITPETSLKRIALLDSFTSGFLYAVSSSSTTGSGNKGISKTYLDDLRTLKLKNPVLIGFGIKDRESFLEASSATNGAIIGSAYIKALQENPDIETATKQFLSAVLGLHN